MSVDNQDKPTPVSAKTKIALGAAGVGLVLAIAKFVGNGSPPTGPSPSPAAPSSSVATSDAAETAGQAFDFAHVCSHGSGATVPTGSGAETDEYYAAVSSVLKLGDFGTLDAVLGYLGFHLTAKALQDTEPATLMSAPNPVGSVLAARFFAPKITDVGQANSPAAAVGWRKLVRLRAASGSAAAANGVEAAFILFNFFAPIGAVNPFAGADSVNTQVMLVSSRTDRAPIYWLDYAKTSDGAKISKELDAFFDAGHTPDNAGKRAYFVPCGCIACHGGLQLDFAAKPPDPVWEPEKPLLNYLDTDHWFDRIAPGEDFAKLTAPVIFDSGGFDVIRELNTEMRDQNQRVQPGSVQQRAASHWLDLHASSAQHVDNLALRALAPDGGATRWNAKDPNDMTALKRLNHYCFRCHGSVEFDVFDKAMLLSIRSPLLSRLQPRGTLSDARATMPPDRDMVDADRSALRAFILAH
ncbi:MAG TPA: hypothetical protein VGH28_02295 [Polyangiaceae bacterium]|jgi:hypothetical protein